MKTATKQTARKALDEAQRQLERYIHTTRPTPYVSRVQAIQQQERIIELIRIVAYG